MELDSFGSIRAGTSNFIKRSQGLNILICNAGVMSCPEDRTKDEFETQFGINHLSHFLLFQLLKKSLVDSSSSEFHSRVVSLASCAHRNGPVRLQDYNLEREPYDAGLAYGQAKTANIYFASEIERRYGGQGVHGLSVHPGLIQTSLLRHIKDSPMAQQFINNPETRNIWKSPEQGAATGVWAAIGKEWEGRGGRYLEDCREAKPFDPTTEFPGHAPGYAAYAYDRQVAEQLWIDSIAMVGAE
jgi:NAD(P)-dependent dehydrogenase (short-subunit alcohol dehydrogenase family)